mmetsp:Transcript_29964/g.28854  ORF Transcript_29964/g.28854 Transcript_29964/m.28854 type:complete len:102 (-) Transcript_29964:181-486(-)
MGVYHVVVPLNANPDHKILRVRHGKIEKDVAIPKDVKPGQAFTFEIDEYGDVQPHRTKRKNDDLIIFLSTAVTLSFFVYFGLVTGVLYSTKPSIVVVDILM